MRQKEAREFINDTRRNINWEVPKGWTSRWSWVLKLADRNSIEREASQRTARQDAQADRCKPSSPSSAFEFRFPYASNSLNEDLRPRVSSFYGVFWAQMHTLRKDNCDLLSWIDLDKVGERWSLPQPHDRSWCLVKPSILIGLTKVKKRGNPLTWLGQQLGENWMGVGRMSSCWLLHRQHRQHWK